MRAKAGVDARTPWRRSGYSLDILKEALLVARPRKRNTIQRAAPGARKVMTGRMSAFGPKRTLTCAPQMSAFEEKGDMLLTQCGQEAAAGSPTESFWTARLSSGIWRLGGKNNLMISRAVHHRVHSFPD